MTIKSITALSGNQYVNFTLKNTGNEKLWNFQKFDVMINYPADISGVSTPRTERFSYADFLQNISLDSVSSDDDICITCNLSHTVAGTDKLLIVGISVGDDTSVNSLTYAGQGLTKIRADQVLANDRRSELWYLVNPTSGTANVEATLSKNEKVIFAAISFNDVHQSYPINVHNGAVDGSATTNPSLSLTTTANNALIVDVVSAEGGPMTHGGSQTERWDLTRAQLVGSGSTRQTTAADSYTMSWTNDGGLDQWATSAVALVPVVGDYCGPNGNIPTNKWTINSISSDYTDPDIINTNESALICTKLAYPIFANGVVEITVSTDGGRTANSSVTAP